MNNPFDIGDDVLEWLDRDGKVDDRNPQEFLRKQLEFGRVLYDKTREAIQYLRSIPPSVLLRAKGLVGIEEARYYGAHPTRLSEDWKNGFWKNKEDSGALPKTLDDLARIANISVSEIRKETKDSLDFFELWPGTEAHYARRLAKYAWQIQNQGDKK